MANGTLDASKVNNNSDSSDQESDNQTSDLPNFFFGGTENDDSSDDSASDDNDCVDERKKRRLDVESTSENASNLPSVGDLFSATTAPTFLRTDGGGKYEIDETVTFDVRKAAAKPKPWLKKSQTVESKEQREERIASQPVPTNPFVAELQAAAAMNSKAYRDDEQTGYAAKQPTPISEMNMKQKKKDGDRSKSWALKEKRKRDLGMSSRGKSTVEEEKRILREQSTGQGFGFD